MIKVTGIKLKVLFALHLFCAMFALLAWPNTVSIESIIHLFSDAMLFVNIQGYLFSNVVFHFCLIWTLAQPSMVDPMMVTGFVNILGIIFEIVLLSIYWPGQFATHEVMFSAVMVIINLLIRPVTLAIIFLEVKTLMGPKDPPHKVEE